MRNDYDSPQYSRPSPIGRYITFAIFAVIGIIVSSVALGSFYTVDQTERAILLRNGAFVAVEEPGLHFKTPFLESAVMISTAQQTTRWDMSTGQDYRMEAYSNDQQPAHLAVSISWHIPAGNVDAVYAKYKNLDGVAANLINRRTPASIKTVFGQYTAVSSIQDRSKFNADVTVAVTADHDIATGPAVIDGVQIEDIQFSKAYIESIEGAMAARVEVQRITQQEEQQKVQAKIVQIKADAAAGAQIAEATARAKSVTLAGEAEASAIRAKGDALKDNPALVSLTTAERWNGVLPATMVPGSAVPFISVK